MNSNHPIGGSLRAIGPSSTTSSPSTHRPVPAAESDTMLDTFDDLFARDAIDRLRPRLWRLESHGGGWR
jgi:hypothetical protein